MWRISPRCPREESLSLCLCSAYCKWMKEGEVSMTAWADFTVLCRTEDKARQVYLCSTIQTQGMLFQFPYHTVMVMDCIFIALLIFQLLQELYMTSLRSPICTHIHTLMTGGFSTKCQPAHRELTSHSFTQWWNRQQEQFGLQKTLWHAHWRSGWPYSFYFYNR